MSQSISFNYSSQVSFSYNLPTGSSGELYIKSSVDPGVIKLVAAKKYRITVAVTGPLYTITAVESMQDIQGYGKHVYSPTTPKFGLRLQRDTQHNQPLIIGTDDIRNYAAPHKTYIYDALYKAMDIHLTLLFELTNDKLYIYYSPNNADTGIPYTVGQYLVKTIQISN